MGYIKKLKSNELVGGTDKTTVYPVTSTEAVFEEVSENNFESQKYLNSHIYGGEGGRINQESITNYNIAKGTISEDRLDTALKTKVQEGYDASWKFKGEYDKWATYDAHDVVYDTATNSSYISLQADNQWHPVNPEDEAYVEGWWQVIMNGKVSTDANNALVEHINNDLTNQVNTAITDANGAIQDMRSETLDAYTEAEQLAQQITDWSSSEISSTPSYTDQHPLSNRASSAQVGYFECGTSSTTQASNQIKTVTAGGYALPTSGGAVKIKMYAANTYTPTTNNPVKLQFNADTTTLKELRYNGEAVSPGNTWEDGETISVYYDGTYYQASNAQGGGGKIKIEENVNNVDFDIVDEDDNKLVRFQNGHIRTKNFNSEIDGQISVGESVNDLEVADPSGNILMLLKDGQIRTKRFNSATDGQITVNESANDLEVTDPAGNILMLLRNGHIMTKEFDSSKLGDEFNYYATEFEDAEQALYDKVRNDIDDKTVVLFITTDAHITTEEPYTLKYAKTFRRMAENIGADAIVSLGDIINEKVGTGWDITANRNRIELYMKDTRNTYIPFLYALAHHEMYSSGYPTFLYGYSAAKVLGKTGKYLRYMKPVFDTNNYANFYVDVEPQGLRMIFLDSANVAGHPAGYTQATVDWLTAILSSTTGKIALFTHVPSKNGYSYNPTNNISKVVNDDLVKTALNVYVQGGGKVLGHYCGHAHCDNYGKESDMEYYIIQTACSVPRVDGGVPSNERPNLGTPIFYSERTVGTINEWCIDVACIHTDIDEVHLFRFGVGQDRSITL